MAHAPFRVGFVYVLTNPAMPGIVKVGKTSWLSEDRAAALYTTGVPEPFAVAFRLATSRWHEVERHAHDSLREFRVNPRREFFRVSPGEAIEAVRLAVLEVSGIDGWAASQTIRLTDGDRLALSLEAGQIFALMSFPDIISDQAELIDIWQAHSDGDLLEISATSSAGHVAAFSDGDPGGEEDPVPHLDRDERVTNGMINGREHLVAGDRLLWLASPTSKNRDSCVLFEAMDYCQVVSRTWSPVSEHGFPLLLNHVTGQPTPEMSAAVRQTLTLPIPRRWAPRDRGKRHEWELLASDPQPPEHWLPQLKRRDKKVNSPESMRR